MNRVESPSLSFAHLSDPHLTTLTGVDWRNLLNKRVLGYLSWRRRRRYEHRREVLAELVADLRQFHVDQIVVTGDLTHIGLPAEFAEARQWLDALGEPADVMIIPGNHDAYVRAPWQTTRRQWLPYLVSDPEWQRSDDGDRQGLWPAVRVRGPVAFIGLDSAVPAPWFMATGRLGDVQLKRLGDVLQATSEQGLFRVVLIHHPPVPGEEKWRKRLIDAPALCEVIAAHGAELVLHGHRHRAIDSRIEVPGTHVPVFGVPSASAIGHAGRPSQYYRFEVGRSGSGWRLRVNVRSYQPDAEHFIDGRALDLDIGG